MRLHIAHANGIQGAVYQPLAKLINANVFSIQQFGHNSAFPVKAEWDALVEEFIQYLIENSGGEKVFLVGHSLGALLSFKVAHARPDLVSGLLMLDPPLLYGWTVWPARLARMLGKIDDFTPARLSKRRKRHWYSLEEAHAYFLKKSFYTQFDKQCFDLWLKHGIKKVSDGYALSYEVDTEVEIFRTTPLYLSQLKGRLRVPAWLVYADDSDVCRRRCVEPFASKYGLRVSTTQGGHMFPLVRLEQTAAIINQCLSEIVR